MNACADHGITREIKVSFYRACVLSTFFYSSETWTVRCKHLRLLESLHKIAFGEYSEWNYKVRHQIRKFRKWLIIANQMLWAGRILPVKNQWLPKNLCNWELLNDKHHQQKPGKRFKDIKNILKSLKIILCQEKVTSRRSECRKTFKQDEESCKVMSEVPVV